MSSTRTTSLFSQNEFHHLKFSHLDSYKSLKPSLINLRDIHQIHKLPCQLKKCRIVCSKLSRTHADHIYTSTFSRFSSPLLHSKNFLQHLPEKVVIFFVGAIIFAGMLKAKPSLALQSKIGSSGSYLEEKWGTQKEKSEDEEMYEKLLEKEPRNVNALKVVLYGKMRRGKIKEAVEYVERLIDTEPEEVEWRLMQALCYEMMDQLSKAKRLFKEILEERPLLLRALHGLAMVMYKNQEGPAVFEMLYKALDVAHREKRVTEERNIKILIAQMHVVKGELDEALKKFQDLVDEDPRDFRPYLCQGIIYSLQEKKKEALELFEMYRSLVPEEFPQRGFLDDVVLAAKSKSRESLQKEYSYRT